jgi:nitroimidazol reductase NimA-like FMN-containing flavoprotein (pyridoxamine 5'-phosphate oxidase superfamily)
MFQADPQAASQRAATMTEPDSLPKPREHKASPESAEDEAATPERIRRLLTEQPYAVLCTQGHSQPYCSLVAFAASDDLARILFSTPVTTRKYRLLTECEHVALLIDSRSTSPADMMRIEAVTATGNARAIPAGKEFDHWAGLLTARHPHLSAFVMAESSALFRVEVVRYFHVHRFQEVHQWVPGRAS